MSVNPTLRDMVVSGGGRIEERFDGVRVCLPNRPPHRKTGAALALLGVAVTLFMLFWMSGPISSAARTPGVFRWLLLAFGLLGLFGLFPGLVMLAGGIGLMIGRTRCSVDLNDERVMSTEHFGPLRWTFRLRWDQLADLRLMGLPSTAGVALVLKSRREKKKPLVIGGMYPQAMLQPLYEEIAARSGRPVLPAVDFIRESFKGNDALSETGRPVERPGDTAITAQEFEGGCAFHIPPAGLRKGSHGLFAFSLVWLTFCLIFFGLFTLGGASRSDDAGVVWLFAVVFIGIGMALMLGAVHMGLRRALVVFAHGKIGVRRFGPFQKMKEFQISAGELSDIRVGPSGMEINDRPVMELQLIRKRGKKYGCLSQLREDELAWIADRLRGFAREAMRGPDAET